MKNLKVDDLTMVPNETQHSDATSCISSADTTTKTTDAYYYGYYYYPGYTDQGYYMGAGDGMELQYNYPPVMLADNGSLVYMMPGIQTSYMPYASYVPVTADVCQQPSNYVQTSLPYGEFVPSPYLFIGDGTFGQSYYGIPDAHSLKPIISSTTHHAPSELNNPVNVHGKHTQSKTSSKVSHESNVYGKGYFPFMKHPVSLKANRPAWSGDEKIKPRSNEQNQQTLIRRDQYNLPDMSTKYDQAVFFVIKSYSEDDIHKSIKYNVWASTPNGNRRLDSAYQDAQQWRKKGSKCPVFLFFSVNASGQFCGVAEMIGRVDFSKSMDFWQQDKWSGYIPVKWHVIKDVPNPQLRHIILENNDNKPVTNSRDTQEVRFHQGIEMLKIFKSYESKTSILDDFDFYESREKVMQEKKGIKGDSVVE